MTCICIDDLRPASFRGVHFWTEGDKGTYGRRNAVHEYPMRDDPDVEDLGEKAQKYSVNGYLVGDDWMSQRDALVAACRARGPAILQLPADGPRLVACDTLVVSRTKDACGYFGVQMEFTSANNVVAPSSTGSIESLIGSLLVSAIPVFTANFDTAYVAANTLPYVSDNQLARITALSGALIDSVEGTPSINADVSTGLIQSALTMFNLAQAYTDPGTDSAYLAAQPVPAQYISRVADDLGYTATGNVTGVTLTNGAAAIVPVVATMLNNLGNSLLPEDAVAVLTDYATWSVNETILADISIDPVTLQPILVSVSDTADAVNGMVFCGTVRSFALIKLAQAISAMQFRTRTLAIQARANIVELFNLQIEMFTEDAIVNILLRARDYAVQSVTQTMATLVPVVTISASLSKPSLYWADRLYRDVSRATELSDRNDAHSPAFMPSTFEALSQ